MASRSRRPSTTRWCRRYYDAADNPQNSVKVAGEGVKATVKSVDGTSRNMLVDVTY